MPNTQMNDCTACCGSAGAVDITGCRMSLYPMCDDFVDAILGELEKPTPLRFGLPQII